MKAVSVFFEIQPEHAEDFRKLAVIYAKKIEEEKGCISFSVFQGEDNPNSFHFRELYVDRQALDAHMCCAEMPEFKKIIEPWVASMSMSIWNSAA